MKLKVAFLLMFFPAIISLGQDSLYMTSPARVTEYLGDAFSYDIAALTPEKFVVAYYEGGSWNGYIKIGTINDTSISFGYPFEYAPGTGLHQTAVDRLSDEMFVLTYRTNSVTRVLVYKIANGYQLQLLDYFDLAYGYFAGFTLTSLSSDAFIIAYIDQQNDQGKCALFNFSESEGITRDSVYTFTSASLSNNTQLSACKLTESRFAITWVYNDVRAITGALDSNDAVTFGEAASFITDAPYDIDVTGLDSDRFFMVFGNSPYNEKGNAVIGTSDEYNNITYSDLFVFNEETTRGVTVARLRSDKVAIGYISMSGNYMGYLLTAEINDNNISFSGNTMFNPDASNISHNPLASLTEYWFVVLYDDDADFNGYVRLGSTVDFIYLQEPEIAKDETLIIYPNPANDHLIVKVNTTIPDGMIRLYDMTGKLVLSVSKTSEITFLDVNALPRGIYELQLDGEANTRKIVIDK